MADLDDFLRERIAEFDPSIPTTPGTRADRLIVQPTTTRFGVDPFDIDILSFLKDRIKQEFPTFDPNRTAIEDLVIKPQAVFLEPLRREILSVSLQQSLEDPTLLLESEADALVANIFVARIEGDRARGIARLFFSAATSFSALPSMALLTASGIRFNPTQVQSITSTDMQSNQEDGFFFLDITVEAELEGTLGQIEVGELTRIEDAPGVVRVTNKARFTGGLDRQSNQELKEFAEKSITERSLTTDRGIVSQILDNFTVENVQSIGFGDPEMDRDIIESVGPVIDSAIASTTTTVSSGVLTDTVKDFTVAGSDVRVGDTVLFLSGPNFGKSFPVTVIGVTTLDLSGSPADDASGSVTYLISQRVDSILTISAIPGGISTTPPITELNNVIHIGNHVDAYVKVPVLDQDFVDLLSLPDPADDKDLADATNIDVDLISYTKRSGSAVVSSGSSDITTTEDLRKFGLVLNDIIQFTSPQSLIDIGPLKIVGITDGTTVTLTLEDLTGTAFSAIPHGDFTDAGFDLLSNNAGIQPDQLPLARVTTVDLMNSASPPQPISGVTVPFRDPVDIRSTDFFSPGSVTSVGKMRLYFLEPTTVQLDSGDTGTTLGTVIKVEDSGNTLYYRPDPAVILGDLGTGVVKVRNPDDGAATPIDTGASNGSFSAVDTFDLTSSTFVVDIDLGDMLVITSGALVTGNFYVTTGVLSGGTSIKVTPDFTGVIPTTGLAWSIIKQEDLTSQRISAQAMALNIEGSLFFMDVSLESYDFNTSGAAPTDPPSGRSLPADEVNDAFDITDGTLATIEANLRSLGFFFKQNTNPGAIRDDTLAFSIQEKLIITFTDRFMQKSVSDLIGTDGIAAAFLAIGATNNNTTGLEARNVRVNFEKAPVVQQIQDFVDSGTGRVVTENILIKHMVPAFLDLVLLYEGGQSEAIAEELLQELIDETDSDEALSVSSIDLLFRQQVEATDVTMPLGLVAIVHNQDRTISVSRSQDALLVGRISHFLPGKLDLTRSL